MHRLPLLQPRGRFIRKFGTAMLAASLVLPAFASAASADETNGHLSFEYGEYETFENNGSVAITINRTGGSAGEVTVDFWAESGSAAAYDDFVPASQTVTFAEGETSKTVYVDLVDDGVPEDYEGFAVYLGNPTGGASTAEDEYAYISIADDDNWLPDGPGVFSFQSGAYAVDENAGHVRVQVVRTDGSNGYVTVDYTTRGGTAVTDQDFTETSGTLTFQTGESYAYIDIPIRDDIRFENPETFTVELYNATGEAGIGGGTTTVTINSEDPDVPYNPGVFEFALAETQVNENTPEGGVWFDITRTNGSDNYVELDVTFDNGTANNGWDYEGYNTSVVFLPGETTKTVSATIYDDADSEGNEYFTATLSNPTNDATLGEKATTKIRIMDDEPYTPRYGAFEVRQIDSPFAENGGKMYVNVFRNGGSDSYATVDYTITGGTATGQATEGSDYTGTSGTLVFPQDETLQNIYIPILDDQRFEGDEKLTITLSNPTGGATLETAGPVTRTIEDNDPQPEHPGELQFEGVDFTVSEGDGFIDITVQRDNGIDGEVAVDYEVENGSATGGEDFETIRGTLVFGPELRYKSIRIPIHNDSAAEEDEAFAVHLMNTSGGASIGERASAIVTIIDNDAPATSLIQVEKAGVDAKEESGTVKINVVRTGNATTAASVNYRTENLIAKSGVDYVAASGTLHFAPGETTKSVTITLKDDKLIEYVENFLLVLSAPSEGATLGESKAYVYITERDFY
ncbi:Calx-beta domain-containing protein [Paenibacillus methanolicus]|uniref:Calx-beta domain-containing protein n=1 Tax=Paenibacillus methanolicus TaxID=582686 RepID=A0A5S5CHF2_9BACL|nr:Calx-beta domain-containing protein [Paenibacillus methanolicus]TYP79190.1 Calx-beta domain-containing protein [Paenibacillus methanolicus]